MFVGLLAVVRALAGVGTGAPEPDSDEALMLRFADGDAAAFETLYGRHERAMYRFLWRQPALRSRADDLTQEVFLRVVRNAKRYKPSAKFTTWMYTIARNLCIDESRRAKHRRTESLDAPRDDDPGMAAVHRVADTQARGGTAEVSARAFGQALGVALDALPAEQREVFVLRHYDGLRFREIAGICGASENTIKSRMRYALSALREALGDYAQTSFDAARADEVQPKGRHERNV